MGTQGYVYDDSCIADAAISQFRVVVAGGVIVAGETIHVNVPGAQDATRIVGVSQQAATASGDVILVRRAGITKVEVASGNIVYGEDLRIHDIRGNADRQGDAWASGDGILGQAEGASAASGDIVECWLNIRTAH